MFVKTMYESALNATNGFIESNGCVVPTRTMPPSAFAWRGAAEAARDRGRERQDAEDGETEQPASGHAISCNTGRRRRRVAAGAGRIRAARPADRGARRAASWHACLDGRAQVEVRLPVRWSRARAARSPPRRPRRSRGARRHLELAQDRRDVVIDGSRRLEQALYQFVSALASSAIAAGAPGSPRRMRTTASTRCASGRGPAGGSALHRRAGDPRSGWTRSSGGPTRAAHRAGSGTGDCGRWAYLGLNQGPPACEAGALPLSYTPGNAPEC